MKIICTQENLKTSLLTVGRVVSSSNTLPILNNLLIKTENGVLKISSTNLEIAITTSVRCKIEEEGEVTVANKTLTELVGNLPNKNINLTTKDNQLFIEAENYHTNIKTLPSEEFPLIPKIEGQNTITLDSQDLKAVINQVVFAASSNQTQPEISGIFLGFDKNELRVAATDRYRLAERKTVLTKPVQNPQELILPQKTAQEISRIIGNQKGEITLVFSETQIGVNFNDTEIISRLVDGQYPDYKQIIPEKFTTTLTTEKSSLINALRAASVFSQGGNTVKLDILSGKQQLVVAAESSELGRSVVELDAKIEGGDNSVLLNHHYLLDSLAVMDSKMIVIKTISDSSPALIVPEGQDDYLYLVMPIKS